MALSRCTASPSRAPAAFWEDYTTENAFDRRVTKRYGNN